METYCASRSENPNASGLPDPKFLHSPLSIDLELVDGSGAPDDLDRQIRALGFLIVAQHVALVRLDASIGLLALNRNACMQGRLSAVLLDPANAAAFERDWVGRERMNAEFNLASLDPAAAPLSGGALLSLATFRAPALDGGVLLVNGAQLRLEPVSRAVVAALRDASLLRFDALCASLADTPPDAVRRAVLDLARHDVVTIRP